MYLLSLPSLSQVISTMEQRTSGFSSKRLIGTIGSTWPMAQVSAADWKIEKLHRYWLANMSSSSSSSWNTKLSRSSDEWISLNMRQYMVSSLAISSNDKIPSLNAA